MQNLQTEWDDPFADLDEVTTVTSDEAVVETPEPTVEVEVSKPVVAEEVSMDDTSTTPASSEVKSNNIPSSERSPVVSLDILGASMEDRMSHLSKQFKIPSNGGKALEPVKVSDKRIVNGTGDINQLTPLKYDWAFKMYSNSVSNNWTPEEISSGSDVADYNNKLTDAERLMLVRNLAYLTTADIMAGRNLVNGIYERLSAPELQLFMSRQVYEEALHTVSYKHTLEVLQINSDEVFNLYRTEPALYSKIAMASQYMDAVADPSLDLSNRDDLELWTESYFYFSAIFEGTWFYHGFTPIFSLQRRNLMKGAAEQLQYIMRDEAAHVGFGIKCLRTLFEEENFKLNPTRVQAMWEAAEAVEQNYCNWLLEEEPLGYSKSDHMEMFRFVANRRAAGVGMEKPFPGAKCACPWLDEQSNIKKEKNFFETRVTEYQSASNLAWD